jgi:hypothetical protein
LKPGDFKLTTGSAVFNSDSPASQLEHDAADIGADEEAEEEEEAGAAGATASAAIAFVVVVAVTVVKKTFARIEEASTSRRLRTADA